PDLIAVDRQTPLDPVKNLDNAAETTPQQILRQQLLPETSVFVRLKVMPEGHQLDPHRGKRLGQRDAAPTLLKIQQGQPDRLQEGIETLPVESEWFFGRFALPHLSFRFEQPQHQIELPDYWIAQHPVTNAQWQCFIDAGGYRTRRYWSRAGWRWLRCGWEPAGAYSTPQSIAVIILGPFFDPLVGLLLRRQPFSQPHPESWDDPNWNGANQPVTGISFYEAEAYCRWLQDATGHPFRLPTEAEWEKAARGPDGRRYPWGNAWADGLCNSSEARLNKPSPVGSFPAGTSVYDAHDMAGNVWQWCATRWKSTYPGRKPDVNDRLLDLIAWWAKAFVIRGGAYWNSAQSVRASYRNDDDPRSRDGDSGLRVASHSPLPGSES
ncbi:MAG: hypothetical protein EOM24_11090, partial [Chloroflexia bacterium]|nr:hypothetical protein [Chloroflexia bacterium]